MKNTGPTDSFWFSFCLSLVNHRLLLIYFEYSIFQYHKDIERAGNNNSKKNNFQQTNLNWSRSGKYILKKFRSTFSTFLLLISPYSLSHSTLVIWTILIDELAGVVGVCGGLLH